MPEQSPPKQSSMRVLMIGTFDPDYTRNRQLVRLMRARGVDLRTEAVPLWGTTRFDAMGSSVWSKARLAWRVMAAETRVAWTFLRAERPDVVLVGFPGQLDAVVLGVLCRLRRVPMVLEFFISMHETMVTDRQLVGAGGLLARLLGWVDRTAVRLSAVVLADTPADAAFIAEVGGIDSHRVAVVPISPDPERFNPAAGTARSGEPGVVLFYGTFIPLHGIETIVRAAAEPDCAHLHFRLLGDGQQRRHIEQLAADIGAPVEFMDAVPESRAAGADRSGAGVPGGVRHQRQDSTGGAQQGGGVSGGGQAGGDGVNPGGDRRSGRRRGHGAGRRPRGAGRGGAGIV